MTTLDDIIKSIDQSSFSKEDKMYIEVIANIAYVAGARDTIKDRVDQIETQFRLNEQPTPDELVGETSD